HRLHFAFQHSVLPEKKELYKKALGKIESQYSSYPLSALAAVRIAQLMIPQKRNFREYDNTMVKADEASHYPEIKNRLEKIISQYPESEGGILAKQMLQEIRSKSLNLTAEEVVLPNEPSKVLVSYRNVS